MYKNIAIILAGGSGSRIKSAPIPKQFIEIDRKPVIIYTLEAFQTIAEIDVIIIVSSPEYIPLIKTLVQKYNITKAKLCVAGGCTRQASSLNGLAAAEEIAGTGDCIVCIHDCARPLVSRETIEENLIVARKFGGCTTAVSSSDTILESRDGVTVFKTLDRTGLYAVQTPQSFVLSKILAAHEAAASDNNFTFTDDSGLYLKYGEGKIGLAAGSKLNFKITVDEDLRLFEAVKRGIL